MPTFTYNARTTAGEKSQGAIDAPDRRSALVQLERRGLVPVSVTEAAPAKPSKTPKTPTQPPPTAAPPPPKNPLTLQFQRQQTMTLGEVLLFTRELHDLLESGMTLGKALNSLARRKTHTAQDAIVLDLRDQIIKGASLSNALAVHRDSFSNLYVSMIRAGEASGETPEALERLAKHYERVKEAREKVIGALTYPAIVIIVGILTIIFTMTYVVPKFADVFADLGRTLPLPTRMLMAFSSFLLNYGLFLLAALIGGFIFFRRYIRTPKGRLWWHARILRFPVIHRVITANAYAQFARTLSALLNNGVPVLQALTIVEQTMGNQVIANEIREARDRVTDGSSISGPLAAGKVFPSLLTDMLAVGEESGDMSGALAHIAKRYDDDLDRSVKVLTTILEPIMILFIAVGVGFVAVSMLMAVFELTSGLNV